MTAKPFIHPKIGEEIGSVSGHYSFLREGIITYCGRDLLYLVGYAVADSACCGTGACVFCRVAGFVINRLPGNDAMSEVDPVTDPMQRREIDEILREKEGCTQVNYF
jgi:hypothetical protein